jgi:hypothetical protein
MEMNDKDLRIRELLSLPIENKHFEEYKALYLYVTGKTYNGTCTSCGMKRVIGLLSRYNNKFN